MASPAKRRLLGLLSKTYSNWWFQTPDQDCKLVQNYKLLFKTGLHIIICHLSVAIVRGEWLLRMISSVCLFTNVNRINQHYKLKPKIIFDGSFKLFVSCTGWRVLGHGPPLEPYFWLPSHSNLWIVSRHYLKTKIYIN